MKVRIKFTKSGAMIYVGHLDMVRYFQKAMRRAHIDIAYTEGFSPHQVMSFAQPLGLGLYSQGEYIDIEAAEGKNSAEAVEALNSVMAPGVTVKSYRRLPDEAKNAMSVVACADYRLDLDPPADHSALLDFFEGSDAVLAEKKGKKGTTLVDIRPMILSWNVAEDGRSLDVQLSAGSARNCKPDLVTDSLFNRGILKDNCRIRCTRLDLYANAGTEDAPVFVSLESMGEDIV